MTQIIQDPSYRDRYFATNAGDYNIRNFFLGCLRSHFALADRISQPKLKIKLWDNTEATKIKIEVANRDWFAAAGQCPTIILKRNSSTMQRISIADKMIGGTSGPSQGDIRESTVVGSCTAFCTSTVESESELIAMEVFDFIAAIQSEIPRQLCGASIRRVQVAELGATGTARESRQIYLTPVTIGYAYSFTRRLLYQGELLTEVSLNTGH